MTDLEKAARMALEALGYYEVAGLATTRVAKSITALRKALEQPAQQQEPVISTAHGPWIPSTHPGEEGESYCQRCLLRDKFLGSRQCEPHIVEQPAQQQEQSNESAYQRGYLDGMSKRSTQTDWEAVAADQAMTIAMMKAERKPWVGLTEDEVDEIDEANWDADHKSWGIHDFARAIETKLKEKNT